tara:strand:- start:242 stop:358 length:117 start_codon:yes stop_codon:yes gene_type:complete
VAVEQETHHQFHPHKEMLVAVVLAQLLELVAEVVVLLL